jgi:hypothetical protein
MIDLLTGLTQSWGETRFLEVTLRFIANSCKETRFVWGSPNQDRLNFKIAREEL